jgi:hypothetical protein
MHLNRAAKGAYASTLHVVNRPQRVTKQNRWSERPPRHRPRARPRAVRPGRTPVTALAGKFAPDHGEAIFPTQAIRTRWTTQPTW